MSTERSENTIGIPAAVPTDLQQAQTQNGILKKDLAVAQKTLAVVEQDWARLQADARGAGMFHDLLLYAVSAATLWGSQTHPTGWDALLALAAPAVSRGLRALLGKSV